MVRKIDPGHPHHTIDTLIDSMEKSLSLTYPHCTLVLKKKSFEDIERSKDQLTRLNEKVSTQLPLSLEESGNAITERAKEEEGRLSSSIATITESE
jgi:hypothetical protein